jgi:TonB family protein
MFRPLLMLVVAAVVVVPSISAESLAEAAQREKQRRAELGPQSYVDARELALRVETCATRRDRSAPCRLDDVRVVYPVDAIRDGVQGVVLVNVLVDAKGAVAEVAVMKAPTRPDGKAVERSLVHAATAAIRRVRYAPAEKDGVPVDAWVTVKVPFRLPKSKLG